MSACASQPLPVRVLIGQNLLCQGRQLHSVLMVKSPQFQILLHRVPSKSCIILMPDETTVAAEGALFEPGLAQAVEDMIDPARSVNSRCKLRSHKGEVRVEPFQIGERGLRFLDPPELGKRGDDIAQTGRPIAVERPGPSAGLDRLARNCGAGSERRRGQEAK